MKAFVRLWGMCLWLTATSPLCWLFLALLAVARWRYPLSQWVWLSLIALASMVALGFAVFVEKGGALYERVRLAEVGRILLVAGFTAIAALSLVLYAVTVLMFR
ncbi:MAG: hypothetical protein HPY54_14145 [Chthonomonadetes bacterium]|nr:hypothetical protein [Chthonomonadetes bacterium]